MHSVCPLENWNTIRTSLKTHSTSAFLVCLWCVVYLEGLQEADPSAKESYQMLIDIIRKVLKCIGLQCRTVTGWTDGKTEG